MFSFTETAILASGDVTVHSLTQISGAPVKEFVWNSATGGECLGVIFSNDACAGLVYASRGPVVSRFSPGSFLAPGTFTGDQTIVTITPVGITPTPEPSSLSLVLLGSGLIAGIGAMRRRLSG
jgi:hypothetical protein